MRMLNFQQIGFCMDVPAQAQRDRPDHRRLCMRAEMTLDQPTVPGSAIMMLGIANATRSYGGVGGVES
jgi:hypothetical protein